MLSKEAKIKITEKYGRSKNDTGSAEVQVALLSVPYKLFDHPSATKTQRSRFPQRTLETRRTSPQLFELLDEKRHGALPGHYQAFRNPQINPLGVTLYENSRNRIWWQTLFHRNGKNGQASQWFGCRPLWRHSRPGDCHGRKRSWRGS